MNMIKKLVWLERKDFYQTFGLLAGIFLVFELIIAGVMIFLNPDGELPMVGGMIVTMFAVLMTLILSISYYGIGFHNAVSMGQTRKQAFGRMTGLFLAMSALLSIGLLVLVGLDRLMMSFWLTRNPALFPSMDFVAEFPWWVYPICVAMAMALGLVIATVMSKYGSKGGTALMFGWLAWILVGQKMDFEMYTSGMAVGLLELMGILSALLGLGMIVWSVREMLRMPIR